MTGLVMKTSVIIMVHADLVITVLENISPIHLKGLQVQINSRENI